MPNNHEVFQNNESEDNSPDYEQIDEDFELQQRIGAKVLAQANFQDKQFVKNSFDRGKLLGEKYNSNNPSLRRTEAYLRRLNKIISRHGSKAEKRLWEASCKNIDTIETGNITDATWKSIQQDHWDHGGVVLEDTPELRAAAAKEYSAVQKADLEVFADYFSSEDCPYPTWFKVYAWDGITRLSRITREGKEGFPVFQSRDQHTAATFPDLNPAALAKVYDDITSHYKIPTDGEMAANPDEGTDEILKKLIESGSFAKLYSYEKSKLFDSVKVPEKTEDIHGQWVEYDIDQVDEISRASSGTPWCIVSPSTAKNYLKYGTYGPSGRYQYKNHTGEKSRFLLFHLDDPETGDQASSACASIRLDPNGNVAEISGVLGGSKQLLHDSLLPIVKEKVEQLPGGESKLQAFLDNEMLISLDKKFDRHEPFTDEELEFVMWTKRPIQRMNHAIDERVNKLFDIPALVANGNDVERILDKVNPEHFNTEKIIDLKNAGADEDELLKILPRMEHWPNGINYIELLDNGINPNKIVGLEGFSIDSSNKFKKFVEAGADADNIVKHASLEIIFENYAFFKENCTNFDINAIVDTMTPEQILKNRKRLLAIDFFGPNKKQTPKQFFDNARQAFKLQKKTKAPELFKRIGIGELKDADSIKELVEGGIDTDRIIDKLSIGNIHSRSIGLLLDHHANVDRLVEKLSPDDILDNLTELRKAGAQVDANALLKKVHPSNVILYLTQLRDAGATIDIDKVMDDAPSFEIPAFADTLLEMGADTDKILQSLHPMLVHSYLKQLLRFHADANKVLDRLGPNNIYPEEFFDLYAAGASLEKLVEATPPSVLGECIDSLQSKEDTDSQNLAKTLSQYALAKFKEEIGA